MTDKKHKVKSSHQVAEEERQKLQDPVTGKFTLSDLSEACAKRINGDLRLLGINTDEIGRQWSHEYVRSRRPDWNQVGFEWYQSDLVIPIDDKGTEVALPYATIEHWNAYREIRNRKMLEFKAAEKGFERADKWATKNLPKHDNLDAAMKANGVDR